MKTPEEYFQENVRLPEESAGQGEPTPAEKAFMEKYMGMGGASALSEVRRYDPSEKDSLPGFAKAPSAAPQAAPDGAQAGGSAPAAPELELDEQLRREADLQLVSFLVDEQEFAVPIITIQEVIRAVAPTRLPKAPMFVEGVINLRGRVTPLISMRSIMGMAGDISGDRFIIVCNYKGLQVGMIVTSVVTMYRAQQKDIEWSIEASIGIRADFLAGLMKKDERLINIISVDRLVTRLLAK
ncbi:CheW protein [Desulfovibrio sp. X2]|uniref:chemotaxis protein CheW n=1 Tax=Desulfovibrio sp. X2 TaxID=941449 RepID=UPI0003587700|nr:chemotaxis protein CheW [Desulfovibrio sp. X2]EPR37304.1 CheW protein [Desulfovibrio sp. X2]